MNEANPESAKAIEDAYQQLKSSAESAGYQLNPDIDFTIELIKRLLVNENRYGYSACPCRLASGVKADDLDIICPCDYRDPDLAEYDACYCGLYVSQSVVAGKKAIAPIPERRPPVAQRKNAVPLKTGISSSDRLPVWRCKVCGYLCARGEPPELCPICKAKKERFELFPL